VLFSDKTLTSGFIWQMKKKKEQKEKEEQKKRIPFSFFQKETLLFFGFLEITCFPGRFAEDPRLFFSHAARAVRLDFYRMLGDKNGH